MSANNQLVITKTKTGYILKHIDMDCGEMRDKWPTFTTLEEAVNAANDFLEENEVEYGMDIDL